MFVTVKVQMSGLDVKGYAEKLGVPHQTSYAIMTGARLPSKGATEEVEAGDGIPDHTSEVGQKGGTKGLREIQTAYAEKVRRIANDCDVLGFHSARPGESGKTGSRRSSA